MPNLVCINNKNISIKEYNSKRVVTFREIDEVHGNPEGYARRNFHNNIKRFIEGTDYFKLSHEECLRVNITQYPTPNGLVLLTEQGYKMIAKTLTDDKAWQVQRELVDTYFKVKEEINPMLEVMMKDPIMAIRYNQIQMEEKLKQQEEQLRIQSSKQQLIEKRLDNLDAINIEGTEQQRLNAIIRKYSFREGVTFSESWKRFKQAFNTSFHTNLETLMNNFAEKHGLKKITAPQYLSMAGKIEDALRVADKMLNKGVA